MLVDEGCTRWLHILAVLSLSLTVEMLWIEKTMDLPQWWKATGVLQAAGISAVGQWWCWSMPLAWLCCCYCGGCIEGEMRSSRLRKWVRTAHHGFSCSNLKAENQQQPQCMWMDLESFFFLSNDCSKLFYLSKNDFFEVGCKIIWVSVTQIEAKKT